MHLDAFLALVLRVANGILAVQSPSSPVDHATAVKYATAIVYHAERNGIDPFEMVGVARNETDFRPNLVGPDGLDCGIMQTRILYSRYSCNHLRRNVWTAFAEGARELRENQRRCERRHPNDVTRCRINSYNSGIRYARAGRAGKYWLRVLCFAEAAARASRPGATAAPSSPAATSRG